MIDHSLRAAIQPTDCHAKDPGSNPMMRTIDLRIYVKLGMTIHPLGCGG